MICSCVWAQPLAPIAAKRSSPGCQARPTSFTLLPRWCFNILNTPRLRLKPVTYLRPFDRSSCELDWFQGRIKCIINVYLHPAVIKTGTSHTNHARKEKKITFNSLFSAFWAPNCASTLLIRWGRSHCLTQFSHRCAVLVIGGDTSATLPLISAAPLPSGGCKMLCRPAVRRFVLSINVASCEAKVSNNTTRRQETDPPSLAPILLLWLLSVHWLGFVCHSQQNHVMLF